MYKRQALANDGKAAKYSQNELNAFKSGKYPYYYPNVNWWDEVFRERGSSDIATLTFRGGASKLRYYTDVYKRQIVPISVCCPMCLSMHLLC